MQTYKNIAGIKSKTGQMLVQPKLRINKSGDVYEQEADSVADKVMRITDGQSTDKTITGLIGASVQRKCAECEGEEKNKTLMRKSEGDGYSASPSLVSRLSGSKGGGFPLPEPTRNFMENAFSCDFSNVRVHADGEAADMSSRISAKAFALGRDIYFNSGEYKPKTRQGKHLIAHELTHVVQQGKGVEGILQKSGGNEPGPQSFAPERPGVEKVDPGLLQLNKNIEAQLMSSADAYFSNKDLRWYFTYAHALITSRINNNITLFQRPNALIRLNISFAEEFLMAVNNQPSEFWQLAFKKCRAFDKAGGVLVGETELCGASMANVHIHIDLANALKTVGCIPPADYGNMLVFIKQAALVATRRLRGPFVAEAELILNDLVFGPVTGLEVKAWRNAVYGETCNAEVPSPEDKFSKSIK